MSFPRLLCLISPFFTSPLPFLPQQSMLCRMALSRPSALLSNWLMMAVFLERWADRGSSTSPAPIRHSPWAGPSSISPFIPPPPPLPQALGRSESSPTPPWPLISPSKPPPGLEIAFRSAADLEDCWGKWEISRKMIRGVEVWFNSKRGMYACVYFSVTWSCLLCVASR